MNGHNIFLNGQYRLFKEEAITPEEKGLKIHDWRFGITILFYLESCSLKG